MKALSGLLALVLILLSLASCPTATYTLTGTINKTGIADGTFGEIKLVSPDDPMTAAAKYWAKSAPFSGGSASYSIEGIAPDDYSIYAFIDVNGDIALGPSAAPGSGSWASTDSQDITMNDDETLNFPDNSFSIVH